MSTFRDRINTAGFWHALTVLQIVPWKLYYETKLWDINVEAEAIKTHTFVSRYRKTNFVNVIHLLGIHNTFKYKDHTL